MDNESNDVDINNEEVSDNAEQYSHEESETQDRSVETPEAKRARLQRQLNQLEKKHPELVQQKEQKQTESRNSGELDYGQKAFLAANGVKGSDEMKLFQEIMRNTGKRDLEAVLESKYWKSELEELRALRSTAEANPSGSKRSGQSSADSVDYWIAKGELPPVSNPELRRQVVNARLKKSDSGSPFYNG
jgi:hypothetical protein